MHTVPVARKASVTALVALLLLVGALLISAPKASAGLGQCPQNAVCAWETPDYGGNFSWWPASSTGCHNHANNPHIRSAWNRTNYWVRFGGLGTFSPNGGGFNLYVGSMTGDICWPV